MNHPIVPNSPSDCKPRPAPPNESGLPIAGAGAIIRGKVGEDLGKKRKGYIFAPEPTHHGRHFLLWVLAIVTVLVLILFTLNFVNNHQVELVSMRLTVQNLPEDLENWSILHISDLHGQEIGDGQSAIARAISGKNYSCVVFTGDMVGVDGNVQPFLDLLAVLPQDVPKFLIAGDSDPALIDTKAHASLSVFADWVQRAQDAGVTVLDEPLSITRGKSTIWFVPEYLYSLDLDSMETAYQSQLDDLNQHLTSLTPDQAAQKRAAEYQLEKIGRLREIKQNMTTTKDIQIAVTHTPLTADYMTTMMNWQGKDEPFALRHASLILAGHYCGGQWRIPGVGAVYVPEMGWWPADQQTVGLDYLSGIPQYISPGLGASDYYAWQPGRLFNAPTVTLIYLTNRIV